MLNKVKNSDIKDVMSDVFSSDKDLYKHRYHGEDKTLSGMVDYAYGNLYGGDVLINVDTYIYGNGSVQGFFSINEKECILRSFGIKKEYRGGGYNTLFWKSLRNVLKGDFKAVVWRDNSRAERFFINEGGILSAENSDYLCYKFKKICQQEV